MMEETMRDGSRIGRLRADYKTMEHVLRPGGDAEIVFRDATEACGEPDASGIDSAWMLVAQGIKCVPGCSGMIGVLPYELRPIAMWGRDDREMDSRRPELEFRDIRHNMSSSHATFREAVGVFIDAQQAFRHVLGALRVQGRSPAADRRLFSLYGAAALLAERAGMAASAAAREYAERAPGLIAAMDDPPLGGIREQLGLRKEMKRSLGPEAFASLAERSASSVRCTVRMLFELAERAIGRQSTARHLRDISFVKREIDLNARVATGAADEIAAKAGRWLWWGEELSDRLSDSLRRMKDTETMLSSDLQGSMDVVAYRVVVGVIEGFVEETGDATLLPPGRDRRFWPDEPRPS